MSRRLAQAEHGAAAVEFALILPVLVLLVVGVIEFGRGYNAKITLTHAAREGARAAAVGKPAADVVEIVQNAAIPLTIAAEDISVPDCSAGDAVTVTVDYPFSYTTGLFGGTLNLTSSGTMRCGG